MTTSPHRCLIVDDSAAFCAAARDMLVAAGMDVVGTASTTEAALRTARAERPDVILVDIDLGGESGFDVVAALHDDGCEPQPVMIMVSTHDEDDFADMVEASAATAFVQKFALSADVIRDVVARTASAG